MSSRGAGLAYGLPPDISRLLHTNDPRADYQVAEITNSLEIARTLKSRLGLQITEMRMNLLRLEREELHATRYMERCEFALAPIRRIPPEILSLIFLCYTDVLGETSECLDVKKGVWILGHICGYWRSIALSTPDLWTFCRFISGTQTKNAPGLTLSIRLDYQGERTNLIVGHPSLLVLDRFLARCTQWADVELHLPDFFYTIMDSVRNNLPILRKLKIIAGPSLYGFEITVPIFSAAPELRELSLIHFERWSLRMEIPWYQLTAYAGHTGHDILHNPTAHILSRAPKISLRFSASALITLPSLERLLQRSMATPTSLHIVDFLPSRELIGLLAAAPSVTDLILRCPSPIASESPDDFFTLFLDLGTTPPLLPALRNLSIQGLSFGIYFVLMVGARCLTQPAASESMGVARLESLTLADVGDTHISDLLRIKKLENEGSLKLTAHGLSAEREPVAIDDFPQHELIPGHGRMDVIQFSRLAVRPSNLRNIKPAGEEYDIDVQHEETCNRWSPQSPTFISPVSEVFFTQLVTVRPANTTTEKKTPQKKAISTAWSGVSGVPSCVKLCPCPEVRRGVSNPVPNCEISVQEQKRK
ncbi:hypothetical protein DFH09DRAFT_1092453 [Mycena vulgaris]|nr:hypothetical protein DFH09DRAFT_1092453 [Mycena vulgaris]